jgi:hypothetical protein
VLSVDGDKATVLSRKLVWDERMLSLGQPEEEYVPAGRGHVRLTQDVGVGDEIAPYSDWVCDRPTA